MPTPSAMTPSTATDSEHFLDRALRPQSVAIIGASNNTERISGRALHYLRNAGFEGRIYPVNPTRETVQGLPAFASVTDLPESADIALICLGASHLLGAVNDCADAGIGTAVIFAAAGAQVVIGDLDGEAAVAAASSLGIGDRAIGVACNVVELDQVENLCSIAVESFRSLDIMVNNAVITRDATMRKMSEDQFDQVIAIHLRGTWNGLRATSGIMREPPEGGSIINVSSIAGKVGYLGQTNYSAAKAGIVGMTKAAAKEVGFKNVRVNAIQPGFINTPMTAAMRPDIIEAKLADIQMGRAGEASEIASVVTFLASDMAS